MRIYDCDSSVEALEGETEPTDDRIATLKAEHRGILRRFKLLSEAIDRQAAAGTIQDLISKLEVLLESHFSHEQASLYEPLESRSEMKDSPARIMMAEHRAIGRAFKTLRSNMAESNRPSSVSYEDLQSRIDTLQGLVSEHIRKEEKILFWIAQLEL